MVGVAAALALLLSPLGIVDGLDASARGNEVFRCGQLQIAVVGQRDVGHLHKALAVGACAEYDGAVEVL